MRIKGGLKRAWIVKGGAGGTCKRRGSCKSKSQARKVLGRGASRVQARTSSACLRSQEDWGLEAQRARTVQEEGSGERAGWAGLSWRIWLVLVGGSV